MPAATVPASARVGSGGVPGPLRRFRGDTAPTNTGVPPQRTIADLLDDTALRRADRERRLEAQHAEDQARREKAAAQARERRLDALAGVEDAAWSHVEAMIANRKPAEYDTAVILLTDLQALAQRENRHHPFTVRATALRHAHARNQPHRTPRPSRHLTT